MERDAGAAAPASRASTGIVGLAAVADGAFATGTEIETVKTWGLRGSYNHNWDPYWNSALYGAYAQVQYGNATQGLICGALAISHRVSSTAT